jgi:hypothetical protein
MNAIAALDLLITMALWAFVAYTIIRIYSWFRDRK